MSDGTRHDVSSPPEPDDFDRRVRAEVLRRARTTDAELMRSALERLRKTPDVVVDVGVRAGTPALYEAFPDAQFILVDPQPGGVAEVTGLPANYRFVNVALGSQAGTLTLTEQGAHSSLLDRTERTAKPGGQCVTVAVQTFEELVSGLDPAARFGVKLDTEGFELEIVKGIGPSAARIDFLVSEVSVRDRFVDGYTFDELVAALQQRGLRFYNFLNVPKPKPKRFYDCLFLQADDPLFGR